MTGVRAGSEGTGIRAGSQGSGVAGGVTLTSAGAPSTPGTNSSGSTGIFPANWGGAVGDAFLMAFHVESFSGAGYLFAPTEGTVIDFVEFDDGTTKAAHGLWFIPSYSGSGNPDLGVTIGGGAINTIFQTISFWDVSAGAVRPTQVHIQNKASGQASATSFAGSDGGTWTRTTSNIDGPGLFGISDGTNWIQGRSLAVGDESLVTDVDSYYPIENIVQSSGGSDMTIWIGGVRAQAAVMGDNDGTIGHGDLGNVLYQASFFNFLLGT